MSINRDATGALGRDRRMCGINANGKHDGLFLIDRAMIGGGLCAIVRRVSQNSAEV